MKNTSSLQMAVSIAGGQASLAKILGLKQGHIWWWLNRSKRVPANQVIAIEAATGVSRHDLRPDVFGPAPAPSHTSDRPPAAADLDQERVA